MSDTIKAVPGNGNPKPSPVPSHKIADILSGPDSSLGEYLHNGHGLDRKGAIDDALGSARAITDVLNAIDVDAATVDGTAPGSIQRLAWIAQGLIERAIELRRMERREEGGSDD